MSAGSSPKALPATSSSFGSDLYGNDSIEGAAELGELQHLATLDLGATRIAGVLDVGGLTSLQTLRLTDLDNAVRLEGAEELPLESIHINDSIQVDGLPDGVQIDGKFRPRLMDM